MLRYVMSAIRRKHAATITLLFVLMVASAQAAPAFFDWRNQGYTLPPVRTQGSCSGSCWAVCTIDIMETKIIMQLGKTVDLSEQWLVSCTQGGDGCNGGVLSYALESLQCPGDALTDSCGHSGAVLEADFPYTATNAACHCPYNHHYCINSWSYVNSASHPPTNDQLKDAILLHGPVACHMDVYTDLFYYSSGIYVHTTGTFEGTKAMVLVGWGIDGGQEYWIVKNTWGSTWGISGYCKVAFGTCKIGDWAVYVGSVSKINHFCGEIGQVYLPLDLDKDCYVGLGDLAIFAANWLKCTDLSKAACSWN